jgi:hypothetical protein
MALDAKSNARPEAWVVAAWLIVAAELGLAVFLGLKRPGVAPVKAYLYGPWLLAMAAFLVGLLGVWRTIRRPASGGTQRMVAFGLLFFVVGTASYGLPFPAARSTRPTLARIRVPAEGEWTVAWGGVDDASAIWRTRPDRCFAYVLVLERDGSTRAQPADPASAHARGAAVVAPAGGKVVRVVNDVPDDGALHADDLGNHVVIELGIDEFLFVSGLERGSIPLAQGAQVAAGDPLGRIGFSAFSPLCPEPHLGLHVQDTPEPFWGQGIPFYFWESAQNGQKLPRASPTGRGWFPARALAGDRVRHEP